MIENFQTIKRRIKINTVLIDTIKYIFKNSILQNKKVKDVEKHICIVIYECKII